MAGNDSLRRLGGGRWETRDGRFDIEPQSGTWVIVDNEQADELGLPLVRGPFGSLAAARESIEAARSQGPTASPLAERIEQARRSEQPAAMSSKRGAGGRAAADGGPGLSGESETRSGRAPKAEPEPQPAAPPDPRWLRELESSDQRRARDLIARLERMGVHDSERVVRAEVADGQPALARLAVERALAKALAGSKGSVRAAVRSIVGGADVELGVSWRLVDGEGRRIDKVDIPDR